MFEKRSPEQPERPQGSQEKDAITATDRIAGLTMEAAAHGDRGSVGRALRLLAESAKVADQTDWPDLEGRLLRVQCRELAARLAHSAGDRVESLQIVDEIIRVQSEILGTSDRHLHQTKGWQADLLIELGRFEDAAGVFVEIHQWASSPRGSPLAAVSSRLGLARAMLLLGRGDEEAAAVADAVAELEHVPESRFGSLARNLRVEAQSFASISAFGIAYQLANLAANYLGMAKKDGDRGLVNEFSLFQADMAGRWGEHNEAQGLRLSVLKRLAEEHGPSHPECMRVRGLMASAAYEAGRFSDAENKLLDNASLAKHDPETLRYAERLKVLRDFYLETGRVKVAARVAGSMRSFLKKRSQDAGADSGPPQAVLGADAVEQPDSAERELPHHVKLVAEARTYLRAAELLIKMENGDKGAAEALDKVYEIVMEMPDGAGSRLLDRAENVRVAIAKSPEEILGVVRAKEERLAEFRACYGRSRNLTFAGKLAELAELYFRAGDPGTARRAMRDARATLQECGIKDSALYGHFLVRNAAFFGKDSQLGQKMLRVGERLVRKYHSS
jgi:hypothetical protein